MEDVSVILSYLLLFLTLFGALFLALFGALFVAFGGVLLTGATTTVIFLFCDRRAAWTYVSITALLWVVGYVFALWGTSIFDWLYEIDAPWQLRRFSQPILTRGLKPLFVVTYLTATLGLIYLLAALVLPPVWRDKR